MYRKHWKYFMIGAVSLGAHIVLAHYISGFHLDQINNARNAIELEENEKMNDANYSINQHLDMQSNEVFFLAKQIRSLDSSKTESFCKDFMENNTEYFQLRILTEQGDETLRLFRKDGVLSVVPKEHFQNKAHRYYFEKAIELDEFEVYHSEFSKDMEYGKPMEPLRVTLRHYSPFLRNGKKYLVGLSWDNEKLFSSLSQSGLFLLNENQELLHGNIAELFKKINIEELTTSLAKDFLLSTKSFEMYTGQRLTIGAKRDLKEFNIYKHSEKKTLGVLWGSIFLSILGSFSVIYVIARKRDIHESEKKHIKKIKSNAKRFDRWKASNFIGILQSNAKGSIDDANDTLLAMLGYSKQDLLEGKLDWAKLTPPEFLHLNKKAMKEATDKGFWTPFEKEYFHKNGSRIPVIVGGSMFNDSPDEYIVFVIDITERKRMAEKFERVFNISPDLVGMGSLDGYFTKINFSFKRILGYEDKEFLGRPFVEFIYEDDVESTLEVLGGAVEGRQDIICQNRYRCKDGSYKWIEWNVLAIAEEGVFYTTGRDITMRKQSEILLKAQHEITKVFAESNTVKEAFPRILKAICVALNWDVGEIWECDQLQNALYNTEIWHASSLKVPEFEATTKRIAFPPEIGLPGRVWESAKPLWIEDVVHDTNFIRANIADKEELHGAFGFPIIIGCEVLGAICFFSREIRKPDKNLLDMMAAIGRQIGLFIKRKQADAKLRKLSHAIEQSSSVIVITNAEGNVEYANPKLVQLTGYSIEEVIGANPRMLKSEKTPPEVYKELWDTITSGNEWKGELCNRKKSGGLYWEAVSISPVKNDEGVITSFIAVKDDITERKKMEEALLQSEKLKSIGTVTAGISHDFNNILAIISGTTQLLEVVHAGNKELTDELGIITRAAYDGAEITSKMLKFTRTEQGTGNFVSSDIRDMLTQSIDFTKPRWKNMSQAKGIKYDIDKEGIKSVPSIMCNPTEIREAFINIANNAFDAMPDGGIISFSTWSVDDTVFVSISDTGEGMPEKVKKNMFDPFFSTKGVDGTGLGMSMVYGIVNRHGGKIEVESEPKKGSTFTLKFPVANKKTGLTTTTDTKQEANVNHLHILVVDDEDDIRNILYRFLTRFGHNVRTIDNGASAIDIIRNEDFDLILCDLAMPDVFGIDVIKSINRLEKRRPKVGVITGWDKEIEIVKGENLQVDFYQKKPFRFSELTTQINDIFDTDSRR